MYLIIWLALVLVFNLNPFILNTISLVLYIWLKIQWLSFVIITNM